LPCGFLPSTVKDVCPRESKSRRKRDHSPFRVDDGAEEDGELSEEEDEAEYYSLYDQPSTSTIAEQNGGSLQEETRLKQGYNAVEFAEEDTQMEKEPVSGNQEPNVTFDVSTRNPAAPAFEPEGVGGDRNKETSQVHFSPAPDIVRAEENPPNVPEMDLSEHCSPRDGSGIGLVLTEESGNVKEHSEVAPEEEVVLRRSSRDKTAPKKLTYPTLGNPLVTVMHSILTGLNQAFSQTLSLDTVPYVCHLTLSI